ncbi:hypothetical protein [Flavobacterium gilvum]|nr:hypothetical protein [Flavobacterium gilvum]KFC59997.1 hypothetical protein FEM08_11760 [Flavobacterium gilvum]
MKNCRYNEDIKAEWVQWVTGDTKRTSLTSITQAQAKQIIMQQEGAEYVNQPKQQLQTIIEGGRTIGKSNWGLFDKDNQQHRNLLSQLRTLQWTKEHGRHGEVADLDRLSDFLKSDKSPVKKPLKQMTPEEVSKIIECFKSMIRKTYK